MKVLIVGGGIGGPALAAFLAKQGIEVTLIDQADGWKNIGFGLTLWGIGRKILKKLGIDDELAKYGYEVPLIGAFSIKGKKVWQDLHFGQFRKYGGPVMIVPRSKLHELLIERVEKEKVRVKLGTKVSMISHLESNKPLITFNDSEEEFFDLVVGADGVSSQIREMAFSKEAMFDYGWEFWVFWSPEGAPIKDYAFSVTVGDVAMGFWPLKERGFFGIGQNVKTNSNKMSVERKLNLFKNFLVSQGWQEKHFEEVLSNSENDFFDKVRKVKMGPWYKNRIALLGDARHAFAPIIGMGASLALEDAYVLSEEISKNKTNVKKALKNYSNRRDGRVKRIRMLSNFIEKWGDITNPKLVQIKDRLGPYIPEKFLVFPIKKMLQEKI